MSSELNNIPALWATIRTLQGQIEERDKRLREREALAPNNSAPCPHCRREIDSLYDRIGGDSETGVDEGQENATVCPFCGGEIVIACDRFLGFRFSVRALDQIGAGHVWRLSDDKS